MGTQKEPGKSFRPSLDATDQMGLKAQGTAGKRMTYNAQIRSPETRPPTLL